jgi:glycine/D-amino acid oxidase-like deaminating enzyme
MSESDLIVIGQGLAGTTLAWTAWLRGLTVQILDRGSGRSASRVAAGLITPITGLRMAITWQFDRLLHHAESFYRQMEAILKHPLYSRRPALRIFLDRSERDLLVRKSRDWPEDVSLFEPDSIPGIHCPHGGFTMNRAGRLNVSDYLELSREWFRQRGMFIQAEIDPTMDIIPTEQEVKLPRLGLRSRWLVFCQGYEPANPWFPRIPFEPAKGELLTLSLPGWDDNRVIHGHGVWLAANQSNQFRLGATYNLDRLDERPTTAGAAELLERFQRFFLGQLTVIGHDAAVRPIVRARKPLLSCHPDWPCLGVLNGLGSKGALAAPEAAYGLIRYLQDGVQIDPDLFVDCVS